jgi:hypothetical protein
MRRYQNYVLGKWVDGEGVEQDDLDNHVNQLNPNNDEYWHFRED